MAPFLKEGEDRMENKMSTVADFLTARTRPAVNAAEPDPDAMEREMAEQLAREAGERKRQRDEAEAIRIRDEGNADASTVVSRAIHRGGRDPMVTTPNDAGIITLIQKLLAIVSGQPIGLADPAFQVAQKASNPANAAMERAMRNVENAAADVAAAVAPAEEASGAACT